MRDLIQRKAKMTTYYESRGEYLMRKGMDPYEQVDLQAEKIMALEKEIERLSHEIDVQCSSEYVERILKENERLQKKCDYKDEVIDQRNAWNRVAEKEIERLQKRVEGLERDRWKPEAQRTNERLRAALERIDVETSDEYAREIAREMLYDKR